jgi:hypothetical protein
LLLLRPAAHKKNVSYVPSTTVLKEQEPSFFFLIFVYINAKLFQRKMKPITSILTIATIAFACSLTLHGSDAFSSQALLQQQQRRSTSRPSLAVASTRSPLNFDISALYSKDPEDGHDTVASAYTELSGLWSGGRVSSSSFSDKTFVPRSPSSTTSYATVASYYTNDASDDDDNDSAASQQQQEEEQEGMFFAPPSRKSHRAMKEAMLMMDMFYSTGSKVENDWTHFQ